MPGPKPKERAKKICPTCATPFLTRWTRQVCCSRTCARKRDAAVYGPSGWKGGTTKHGSGYIKEQAKKHPYADDSGYVMQHRLVMERVLGRYLERYESVHHKNGKRDDNRPENLEVWIGKDPPGQRMRDLLHDFLSQPEITDRAATDAAFRRVFKV